MTVWPLLTFGGFGAAFSRDITPLCRAERAFSPTGTVHAVARNSSRLRVMLWSHVMESYHDSRA
ncbi:hypothetical protein D3J93_26030 [Salmonella enterica]|nr:hypothetical protein [Salmonella enterica]